ncbi:MAG: phosphoglycerate kinase [Alphaproteobacteria bacterium]|nr:phosphoglycerate kinase [Alphaproteobacteria bacterium]
MAALHVKTLDNLQASGKVVLVRVDLNVPMEHGRVADLTRIRVLLPTLTELADQGAKVVLLAHFDRPQGRYVPALSLSPLVDVLQNELNCFGDKPYPVKFGVDCIGNAAQHAIDAMENGDILMLENLRFHSGEEENTPQFASDLAALGDVFVNDAFSVSHRAHASVVGITEYLPAYAGRLLQKEVEAFDRLLENPQRPLMAVVGGAKISTKLEILEHLCSKVDTLVIGGAMANTFLLAQGKAIGTSLHEPNLVETAKRILAHAKKEGCAIILPQDVVVTHKFAPSAPCEVVSVENMPNDKMQLDVGPETVLSVATHIRNSKSLIWNGPMGAFETRPFDASTTVLARMVAGRTHSGELFSMAGGGDTVSALSHAGLEDCFSYLSTAGGAFLEWIEGKQLPGIAALEAENRKFMKTAITN